LLILSQPVFSLSATSGGFDLLSTLLIFWSLERLWVYLTAPSADHFGSLWVVLLLLSQSRYESPLLAAVICASSLVLRWPQAFGHLKQNKLVLAVTPLFLVLLLCQRILSAGHYESPPGVPPFSLTSLWMHFRLLVREHFRLDAALPYNL